MKLKIKVFACVLIFIISYLNGIAFYEKIYYENFSDSRFAQEQKNVKIEHLGESRACVEMNDWYCLQGDEQHTGTSSSRMLDSNTTYWTTYFDTDISASPIVINGTCYIVTQNGYLSKLYLENGSFITNLSLGGIPTSPLSSSPTNGKIVIGLSSGEILIISIVANFEISRRIPLVSFGTQAKLLSGALFIENGFIIASSYDNGTDQWTIVYKFDLTGNELQNLTFAGMCTSTPAFDGNSIYICIGSKLYLLSQSLTLAWSQDLGTEISSSPVVYGGRVGITAGSKGFLFSSSGVELWSINTGNVIYTSPLFRAGYAYFASSDGRLYIVNITSGANTSILMQGEIVSSPVQADGKFYFACSNLMGTVQCLNATSNEEVWQAETGSPIVNSLAISSGVLLVPAGNVLHAFGGVKRGVSLIPQTYTKYFSPGCESNFTIYVKNEGNVADNVELYLSEVPEDWYASLSLTQIFLQPNEIAPILLNVRAPFIRVDSTAMPLVTAVIPGCMSSGIRLGAVLIVNYDFSFECIDAIKDVKVNSTVTYSINITNLGNIDENYNISVESYPSGWNPHLSTENIHLEIAESKMLYLNVTSPRNALANETARIIVKATSTSKPELSKTIVTTTIVEPMYFMDIECTLPNKVVQPGGNVTFWLHITNRGNDMDSAILNLTSVIFDWSEGWKVNFSQPMQIIAPHEFFDVPVTITAPENATAGKSAIFTINSTSCGNNSAYDFISLTSVVMQKFDIDAKNLSSNNFYARPGESVSFQILINNLGNGPDFVSLKIDSISPYYSFSPSYYYNDLPIDEIIVQPFSSLIVNFSFIIPSGTPANNYTFICNITNQVGKFILLNFEVNVLKVHLVTVRVLQSIYYSTPGKSVKITFDIINKGNCEDDILLSITGLVEAWIVWQNSIPKNYTLSIGEGKSSLFFYVAIPLTATPSWNIFEIIALSSGTVVGHAKLNLSIELPDLKIVSLTYGKPNIGSWLNMNITFVNDAKVPTGNVEVVLFVNGRTIANDKITILPPFTYHEAVLSWFAQGGKHEIIIRLDPSNLINESNESNNELREIINIKTSEKAKFDYTGLVILCIILLIVVASIALFTLFIKKPKKTETPQEDLSAFTFSSGQTVEELRKAYEEGKIQKPKIDEEAAADLREYDEMTKSKPKLEPDKEDAKNEDLHTDNKTTKSKPELEPDKEERVVKKEEK